MRNKIVVAVVAVLAVAAFGVGSATARDIPGGTITSTVTIYDNSRLTGDVDCSGLPDGVPCIEFGADKIEFNLNSHIMTGKSARSVCPTSRFGEDAIITNGKNNVVIKGPGLIRRFRGDGIEVTGNDSKVERVTVLDSCLIGVSLSGSHNAAEENTVVRSFLSPTEAGPVIVLSGGKNNVVRRNEVIASGGPFVAVGISVVCSSDNLIEENNVSGNKGAGILSSDPSDCSFTTLSIGNIFRHNIVFGNTSIDIRDPNPSGANTYQDNACEVSDGGAAGACPKVNNNAGHENPPTDE